MSAALECSTNPHFNNFNKDCTIRLRAEELFVDVTLATADRQVGQNIYSYEYIYSLYIRKHKYISVRINHHILKKSSQIIRAHRVLLSAGSSYLERVLSVTTSDHPTVVLSGIRYKELKLLVDFMYSGEVAVAQTQFPGLMEAANWLGIRGLCTEEEKEEEEEEEEEEEKKEEETEEDEKETGDGAKEGEDAK